MAEIPSGVTGPVPENRIYRIEEKEKEGGRESYGLSHKTKKEDIENFRLYD